MGLALALLSTTAYENTRHVSNLGGTLHTRMNSLGAAISTVCLGAVSVPTVQHRSSYEQACDVSSSACKT